MFPSYKIFCKEVYNGHHTLWTFAILWVYMFQLRSEPSTNEAAHGTSGFQRFPYKGAPGSLAPATRDGVRS